MSKKGGKGIVVCARVRPLMPFETETGEQNCISEKGNTIILNLKTGQQLAYPFTIVVDRNKNNEDTFQAICKPMVKQCLQGYNCIVVAYGQTGCGKTYTMIGKPHHNPPVLGLVPRTIESLLLALPKPELSLSACDSYGTNPNEVKIYDLFSPKNHENITGTHEDLDEERWKNMTGTVNFDMKKLTRMKFVDVMDGARLVIEGNSRNHFAPTGKNPDSSRGHTVLLINVKPPQDGAVIIDESRFIFNDCAGSEGDTALTPKYVAAHSPDTVLKRKLEGGVINTGLLQLKRIFKDLREHSKLLPNDKTGLKRILYPYVNAQSEMSLLFMMSPAGSNSTATNATLKFAQEAAAIKVKPIKKDAKKNWQVLAQELESKIKALRADGGEGMGIAGPLMLPKVFKLFTSKKGDDSQSSSGGEDDGGDHKRGRRRKRGKKGKDSESSSEEEKQRRKESEPVRDWAILQKLLDKKNNEQQWFSRKELIYCVITAEQDIEIIEEDREQIKLEAKAVIEHMTTYVMTLKKQLEEMAKKKQQKGGRKGNDMAANKVAKAKAKAKAKKAKKKKGRR